jgi:hypothetical protein
VKSQLHNVLIVSIGPQPGTSGKLSIFEQEHGPVLNLACVQHFDLATEPRFDLFGCERAADKR